MQKRSAHFYLHIVYLDLQHIQVMGIRIRIHLCPLIRNRIRGYKINEEAEINQKRIFIENNIFQVKSWKRS